jgi:hypothetical protein
MKPKRPPFKVQDKLIAWKLENRFGYSHITERMRKVGCDITDQYLRLVARGHKNPGPNVVRALAKITKLPQREFRAAK